MTTTRERLDRHNGAARVLVIVLAVVVMLGLAAGALGLWLLPPILAESPRERFPSTTEITLRADDATPATSSGAATASPTPGVTATDSDSAVTASMSIGAGWLALGVGPFLDPATGAFISPDGDYRADLTLVPLDGAPSDAALARYLADHDLTSAASAAAWSEETLTSGLTVRYADLERGGDTVTVAMVTPTPVPVIPAPDTPAPGTPSEGVDPATTSSTPAVLILRATVATADAARYRTVTADIAASVTISAVTATTTPGAETPESPS